MKKFLVITLCIAMAVSLAVGFAPVYEEESGSEAETLPELLKIVPEGDIVVGISTGSSGTSWRDIMIANLQEVGDEYKAAGTIKDYKIMNNTTNGDANEQAQILRNMIDDPEVNVIMVNPNDYTALTEVIAEAQAAGKLVVVFDATAEAPGTLQVTEDHYNADMGIQDAVGGYLSEGDNVVEIYGLDGHPANTVRMEVVKEVCDKYGLNLIQSTTGAWDQTKAKEAMAGILAGGQEIQGVFTQDGMGYGCLSAFQDAGKLPKAMTGDPGTAFFKEWNALREEGADFHAAAGPNPPGIGATAFRLAMQMAAGKDFKDGVLVDNVYFYKPSLLVTDDNFEEGWDLLKDQPDDYLLTEYLSEEDAAALFQ